MHLKVIKEEVKRANFLGDLSLRSREKKTKIRTFKINVNF